MLLLRKRLASLEATDLIGQNSSHCPRASGCNFIDSRGIKDKDKNTRVRRPHFQAGSQQIQQFSKNLQ